MYNRLYLKDVLARLKEPRRFVQALVGPRQVGKTFLITQMMQKLDIPCHYALADEPTIRDKTWLREQWEIGRLKAKEKKEAILVIDEVQKITGWSETVKFLWDSDSMSNAHLKVILLGSSPLLIRTGLDESLAGRFEITHIPHWSFTEMKEAFGWSLKKYIYFGGYPGAAPLVDDEDRWRKYIIDSLIESTISRDVLFMQRIDKPALLRRLFHLGCEYSGQVLSYQKMLGQLQEAGNTVTLAHYLDLLSKIGMLCGLTKFAGQAVRERGSSPKFQVFNNALISALGGKHFDDACVDNEYWGRLVESSVGAHLLNSFLGERTAISYWREGDREVDFVISHGKRVIAIEVKSNLKKAKLSGMAEFEKRFRPDKLLLIGGDGISLEEFFDKPCRHWIDS